jgi:hypothetical protein
MMFAARVQLSPNPSLVLAPESTLRLLPSIALSFAPAACSVSGTAILSNMKKKKSLIFAALSDMPDIRHWSAQLPTTSGAPWDFRLLPDAPPYRSYVLSSLGR